jgi:hypothetical protein
MDISIYFQTYLLALYMYYIQCKQISPAINAFLGF